MRGERSDREDRYGFEESGSALSRLLGKFVPQWLARRSVDVTVTTDRERYAQGDPVAVTVEFRNRLPVPVAVRTPGPRRWGWTVDGELEASDEARVDPDRSPDDGDGGAFAFRPRERKRVAYEWGGRFKRERGDGLTRWEVASPGSHEIGAFVAVDGRRPADATTVEIERR